MNKIAKIKKRLRTEDGILSEVTHSLAKSTFGMLYEFGYMNYGPRNIKTDTKKMIWTYVNGKGIELSSTNRITVAWLRSLATQLLSTKRNPLEQLRHRSQTKHVER